MNKTTININGKEIDLDNISSKETITRTKETIIFYKESAIQSIISDIGSFSILVATFWFNYNFIGGNNFIDVFLLLLFIGFLKLKSDKSKNMFTNKKDLLEFINKEVK